MPASWPREELALAEDVDLLCDSLVDAEAVEEDAEAVEEADGSEEGEVAEVVDVADDSEEDPPTLVDLSVRRENDDARPRDALEPLLVPSELP